MIRKIKFISISKHLEKIEKQKQLCNVRINQMQELLLAKENKIQELQQEIKELKGEK